MRATETYALRRNSAAGANVDANVVLSCSDRYVLEQPPQSANARARNLTSF